MHFPTIIFAVLVGYFLLISTFYLLGGAIEQQRLPFAGGNTLLRMAGEPGWWGTYFAVAMAVLVTVDVFTQYQCRDAVKDFAYYPRIAGIVKSLSLGEGRLVLMVGFLMLFGNYATTAVEVWKAHGPILPLEIAFKTCVVGWAFLWIADCLSRPRRISVWLP